ncbi:cytochrome c oxidase assembly protein [Nocardioides jensenii]|uniref:cytochrome c oxidase assembly protein n=1 Tax=Nocardioides jensenii TaxID=1843 RepID=UPI000AE871F0|nr:cytochrome c oxidase assembly protein [Nocardioides jensenii]
MLISARTHLNQEVLAHGGHQDETGMWTVLAGFLSVWLPLLLVSCVAVGYVWLAMRERGRRGWPMSRIFLFLLGSALIMVALGPGLDGYADRDFGGHMAQHLVLAMIAPLALVLAAPVTLLLRQLPHREARRLGRLLHTRPVRVLSHPFVGLMLTSGGLIVLYFTPLYAVSTRNDAVHIAVHFHLVASGLLFAWAIAGPDPAPARASVRLRLVVLGLSIAIHSVVAQLIFAGLLVQVREPIAEMQAAGNLMYFGGDIAELLLAVALLVTWRTTPSPSRPLGRTGTPRASGILVTSTPAPIRAGAAE